MPLKYSKQQNLMSIVKISNIDKTSQIIHIGDIQHELDIFHQHWLIDQTLTVNKMNWNKHQDINVCIVEIILQICSERRHCNVM